MKPLHLAVALTTLIGALLTTPHARAAATGPAVTVSASRINTYDLSHRIEPVRLEVTVAGDGPFTWSAQLRMQQSYDVISVMELGPRDGQAPLTEGTQSITIGDNTLLNSLGGHRLTLTVTDGHGASSTASTLIEVKGTTPRPTIRGVAKSRSKPSRRWAWGRGDLDLPAGTYRVFFRPAGAKRFTEIGASKVSSAGFWRIRSPRLHRGTLYVEAASPYVDRTVSKRFRIRGGSFRSTLPPAVRH